MSLDSGQFAALAAMVLAAAILYSSVGHAGASGYLAAMALMGIDPAFMKPAALGMNIVVAAVATLRFRAAGHYRSRLFWPFAIGSVPCAFLGGRMSLSVTTYRELVGGVLLLAALWMLCHRGAAEPDSVRPPPVALALPLGGAIGLLAGLVGVGGGIFLSPIVLLAGWAGTRQTAALSAPFILVNSIAGFVGNVAAASRLPVEVAVLASVAAAGGLVGSELGARRLPPPALRVLLALALVVAGLKLLVAARR